MFDKANKRIDFWHVSVAAPQGVLSAVSNAWGAFPTPPWLPQSCSTPGLPCSAAVAMKRFLGLSTFCKPTSRWPGPRETRWTSSPCEAPQYCLLILRVCVHIAVGWINRSLELSEAMSSIKSDILYTISVYNQWKEHWPPPWIRDIQQKMTDQLSVLMWLLGFIYNSVTVKWNMCFSSSGSKKKSLLVKSLIA